MKHLSISNGPLWQEILAMRTFLFSLFLGMGAGAWAADNTPPTISDFYTLYVEATSMEVQTVALDNVTSKSKLLYRYDRKRSSETVYTKVLDYTEGKSRFKMTDLEPGTSYDFRVTVKDEAGNFSQKTVTGKTLDLVKYGLWVGGEQVTNANKGNITSPYINSGTIKYLSDTHELCLYDVDVEAGEGPFIRSEDDLIISLSGVNTIKVEGGDEAIYSELDITIETISYESHASLTVEGADVGIYSKGAVDINRCTLVVYGDTYGIQEKRAAYWMTINDADLMVYGDEKPIFGFSNVKCDQAYLLLPTAADYDGTSGFCFVLPGTTIPFSGALLFERCNLKVGGEYVMPQTPITSGVKEGTVSYDFLRHTLTLDNATIETTSETVPIEMSWYPDMKINLIGNNTINTDAGQAISMDIGDLYSLHYDSQGRVPGLLTIQGDGALEVNAEQGCSFSLTASKMIVKDATVDIVSKTGVMGYIGYLYKSLTGNSLGNNLYESLTLNNCHFSFHNPVDDEDAIPLFYLDGLELIDAEIVSPTDAYFDDGILLWDGGRASTMVVQPTSSHPTTIAQPSSAVTQQPWYTLEGQRIDQPTKPGIYLHGNRKVVISR